MKKHFALFATLLTTTCFSALQANAYNPGIFDEDDRTEMSSTAWPWSTVGRLLINHADGSQGSCTGTVVWRNIVLTAAHCFEDSAGKSIASTSSVVFYGSYTGGRYTQSANGKEVIAGGLNVSSKNRINWSGDWAFLILDKDIGTTTGYLDVVSTNKFFEINKLKNILRPSVSLAGYSHDFKNGDTAGVDTSCFIEKNDGLIFNHSCDMNPGASGGSLINDENEIVGVNIRGIEQEFSRYTSANANLGVSSERFMRKLKELRAENEWKNPVKIPATAPKLTPAPKRVIPNGDY